MTTNLIVESSDERVVLRNSDDEDTLNCIVLDVYGEHDASYEEFSAEFEIVGEFLADDDFYQGLNMTTVIRRKSDRKLFGYSWWNDISKHGESYIESNGDDYGFDYGVYVWLPVRQIVVEAYQVIR